MEALALIRQAQASVSRLLPKPSLKEHHPHILYIGCVDARLDPNRDLGLKRGQVLIFRSIAAQVLKDPYSENPFEIENLITQGEIPANASIGAVLEFFINHITTPGRRTKHIIVSSHTDCGGLKACWHESLNPDDRYLRLYLESLNNVRAIVAARRDAFGWNEDQTFEELEKEATRQNVANLLTYPVVTKAIAEGRLAIHGWVMDTASVRIYEMDSKTKDFGLVRGPPSKLGLMSRKIADLLYK